MIATHLITILDCKIIRVPISIGDSATVIDWLHAKPYTPPALIVPLPKMPQRYTMRRLLMQCDRCWRREYRYQVGPDHVCGDGFMKRIEAGKIRIRIKDKQ